MTFQLMQGLKSKSGYMEHFISMQHDFKCHLNEMQTRYGLKCKYLNMKQFILMQYGFKTDLNDFSNQLMDSDANNKTCCDLMQCNMI